jgi:hypothetical protein
MVSGSHTNNNVYRTIESQPATASPPLSFQEIGASLRRHNLKPTKSWLTLREEVLAEAGLDPAAIGGVIVDVGVVDDEDPVEAVTNRRRRNGSL